MFESLLAATFVGLFSILCPRSFHRLQTILTTFAQSRFAIFGITFLILIFSGILALFFLKPQPRVHDEFSYLLQADTFTHGRLSNPTHPMWKHFETFHVLQQPAYVSKYPPAQGIFLAAGKLLGDPIIGVWLSTALASAALFWMLNAFLPRSWSLVGACLGLCNAQILLSNWNYWGGSVSLLGGTIFLGGFWRILKKPASFPSAMMGFGAGILASSRPFEGFVLCAFAGAIILYRFLKPDIGWKEIMRSMAVPFACAILPFLIFGAYYNYRVTGSALTMPYSIYEKAYSNKSLFLFGSDRPTVPQYHNNEMRSFYKEQNTFSDQQKTLRGFASALLKKIKNYDLFFWNYFFCVLFFVAFAVARRNMYSWSALLLFSGALVISFTLPIYTLPHYSAPIFPALLALTVLGLRELNAWRHGKRRWGCLAVRVLVVFICLSNIALFAERPAHQKTYGWEYRRAKLLAQLEADGRKHLVIVKYSPSHNAHVEWVYNRADIDSAPVVWARDLGEEENQKLLDYFKDREVLTVDADDRKWGK